MSPAHVQLAIEAIKAITEAIQDRIAQSDKITALFEKAVSEGRDFTAEEVKEFQLLAKEALERAAELNPTIGE
jgi:hypothetical protein